MNAHLQCKSGEQGSFKPSECTRPFLSQLKASLFGMTIRSITASPVQFTALFLKWKPKPSVLLYKLAMCLKTLVSLRNGPAQIIWWTGNENQNKQVSLSLAHSLFSCCLWITRSLGNFGGFSARLQMMFWICLFRWRWDKKQEQPSGRINSLYRAGSALWRQDWVVSTNFPAGSLPSGSLSPWCLQ